MPPPPLLFTAPRLPPNLRPLGPPPSPHPLCRCSEINRGGLLLIYQILVDTAQADIAKALQARARPWGGLPWGRQSVGRAAAGGSNAWQALQYSGVR